VDTGRSGVPQPGEKVAIHIIVDGYNLIGSEKGLTGNLEKRRKQLIEQLQLYHEEKGYPVTVVFDGWRSGWMYEVEERAGGISVIFSKRGEKADNVIRRLAEELGSQGVVVSSDREVRTSVEASGASAIYAGEFSEKLKELDRPDRVERNSTPRFHSKRGNPKRLSKAERKRRGRLQKL
jgi:predicted RNA-binding protein with PIN domain